MSGGAVSGGVLFCCSVQWLCLLMPDPCIALFVNTTIYLKRVVPLFCGFEASLEGAFLVIATYPHRFVIGYVRRYYNVPVASRNSDFLVHGIFTEGHMCALSNLYGQLQTTRKNRADLGT